MSRSTRGQGIPADTDSVHRVHCGVSNQISGTVAGPSIQAGAIHGGVHLHVTPAPKISVPTQLLPAPDYFTGRDSELAELSRLMETETEKSAPQIAVISGVGGIGKTALALRFLHDTRKRFTGGDLYANLDDDYSPRAARPGEVLAAFLSALGVPPEHVPVGLGEKAALYRSITANRRIAVLLDNAFSAAQVRPLLPGSAEAFVIVTSRRRIGGLLMDGASFLHLAPLEDDAAVDLLKSTLGDDRADSDPQSARALVGLCDRLPIAVWVAGARLAARPRWPVARMVRHLSSERQRLAALSIDAEMAVCAVFDASYDDLPADAARMYRLCALHPGANFTLAVAAAATDLTNDEADRLLGVLLDANLLEEIGDDRYHFHDLLRIHARQRADESDTAEERQAAIRRMLEWYLHAATSTAGVAAPGKKRSSYDPIYVPDESLEFADVVDAVGWLETERENLLAAVRFAVKSGAPGIAWRIVDEMWPLFQYRKNYSDWLEFDRIGLTAARAERQRHAEAKMLNQMGLAYLDLSSTDDAARCFHDALTIWKELGDDYRIAGSLQRLGRVCLARDDATQAVAHFAASLAIYERLDEKRKVALLLTDFGSALAGVGRTTEALQRLERARRILDKTPDAYNKARVLNVLGRVHLRAGDPGLAGRYGRTALAAMRQLGSFYGQAEALLLLGDTASLAGDGAEARSNYTNASALYEQLASPKAELVARKLAELGEAAGP